MSAPAPSGGLATLWGLGARVPAPGSWGAAAALPLGWLAHWAGGFGLFAATLAAVTALGWRATARHLARTGRKDPSEVIVDEVAGQLVALAPLSLGLWLAGAAPHVFPWPGWVGAFVTFRFFDILKPPPVSWAERLPGAAGVMADDLVAGVLAALCVTLAAALAHGWLA
ncbi:phosphatidylglycerophosphatase A family protein [Oceanicella actignis]|uniref:Phosphatidylglycerophosphatase A n=1 Tax=Oceanicella actignis TaxID=1189325 RepID=A0A1M7RVD9_9RHOB|nr:phosphatidylglycerophosphatase A [Oceanicella actignis]TYO89910.1 phosphatidylglycerophosphatase A [Oceanicella actignis]SET02157.1 phosphatidylglycerophosphatase A [Oceanicella actignis]SHN50170.1 phosphatidylglycerophosphatase A [Oceanicella actignis]